MTPKAFTGLYYVKTFSLCVVNHKLNYPSCRSVMFVSSVVKALYMPVGYIYFTTAYDPHAQLGLKFLLHARNQFILKREREKEACFLCPDCSRNTWSGKFDTYCQQIRAWKIRSCVFWFWFCFLLLLKQEWLPALHTRRQCAFTVAPVALNSALDRSTVSLGSHTA